MPGNHYVIHLLPKYKEFRVHVTSDAELFKLVTQEAAKQQVIVHENIDLSKFEKDTKLSESETSIIFRANWNGKQAVVKQFKNKDKQAFIEEVAIICLIQHPNIIPCWAADIDTLSYVMPFYSDGNLSQFIKKNSLVADELLRKIGLDIATGLDCLNNVGLMQRELKPENILICSEGPVFAVLADVYKTKVVEEKQSTGLVAPENIPVFTEKSEVFAYGTLFWMMLQRKMDMQELFFGKSPSEIVSSLRSDDFLPTVPESCKQYVALLKSCWVSDPEKRITIKQIIEQLVSFAPK